MPKGKRKSKPEVSKLLAAMRFLSVCQIDESISDYEKHCRIQDHTAVAYNNVIAAGTSIEEDLDACPHTLQLELALSHCGEKLAIVQHDNALHVRSGDFEANIPCVKPERLTTVKPDEASYPVTQSLIDSIIQVAPLASDKADVLEAASIQLQSKSVLATNREMVMESWHGLDMPCSLLLPKATAVALNKIDKKIVDIGFGKKHTHFNVDQFLTDYVSITFWYEDGSWLKSNLYKGQWRSDVMKMLKLPSENEAPITPKFFETVKKVAEFSPNGKVVCGEHEISSHNQEGKGAIFTLPVDEGPLNKIYKAKSLLLAGKYCTSMDETAGKNITMFYGSNTRCAVWHDVQHDAPITDEDIPF